MLLLPPPPPQPRARAAERRPVLAPAGLRGRPASPVPAPLRLRHGPRSAGADAATAAVSGRGSAGPRLLPQPADRPTGDSQARSPREPRPAKAKGREGRTQAPFPTGPALQNCPF